MPPASIQSRELASSGAHAGTIVGIVLGTLVFGVLVGWVLVPRVKAFYNSRQRPMSVAFWRRSSASDRKSFFDKDIFAIATPPPKRKTSFISVLEVGLAPGRDLDAKQEIQEKSSREEDRPPSLILPKQHSPTVAKAQSLGVPRLLIPGVQPNPPKPPPPAVIRPAAPDSPTSLYSQVSAATYVHRLVGVAADPPPLPSQPSRPATMTLSQFLRARRAKEEKERMDHQYLQIIAASVGHSRPKGPRPRRKARGVEQMTTVVEGKYDYSSDRSSGFGADSDKESTFSSEGSRTPIDRPPEGPAALARLSMLMTAPVQPLSLGKGSARFFT